MFRGSLLPPSAGQRTGQLHNATRYYAVTERDITGLFIGGQRRVGAVAVPETFKLKYEQTQRGGSQGLRLLSAVL
jgi:hypothetical protein